MATTTIEDENSVLSSSENPHQLNGNLTETPTQQTITTTTEEIKEEVVLQKNNLLQKLRELFKNEEILGQKEHIDAYILPRTDAHNNEYINERDQRVKFISGFSGSNAWVIVTKENALLWTDGRYYIQVIYFLFEKNN
uniref:Creatinase N-terminal domain-containing protein n=1 Tax=Meloidogyne incognita TaxID=6306 RepID=A0A914L802_MELIC